MPGAETKVRPHSCERTCWKYVLLGPLLAAFVLGQEGASKASTADGILQIGRPAPDLRLKKLDGSEVVLSHFRGKRLVINSWASW